MNTRTSIYVTLVAAAAVLLLAASLLHADVSDPAKLCGFLVATLAASIFKVRIPGLDGTYSFAFVVLLAATSELTLAELVATALLSAVTQSYWRAAHRPRIAQVAFNTGNVVISIAAAYAVFHGSRRGPDDWMFFSVGLAALSYYFLNTGLTAGVLCLVQGGPLRRIWTHWNFYTLSYYLVGATLASAWTFHGGQVRWQAVLVAVLLLYLVFRLLRSFVTSHPVPEGAHSAGQPDRSHLSGVSALPQPPVTVT